MRFSSVHLRKLDGHLVECLNGQIIDQQRPLLVKFADDDKRRRQLMARYLPQIDSPVSSLPTALTNTLQDPSDVLSSQMATLNLLANSNPLPGFTGQPSNESQQQGHDMNLLMNTLLMMPFWSNMCAPTMPVLYPTTNAMPTKAADRLVDAAPTNSGA